MCIRDRAHAAGLPCLGARSGGVPEAVGEGGLLVEDPLDVEEVGRALDALLDPDQEGSWREAVRRRRREEPWEGFLGAFEAFYGELAGGTTG